MDKSKKLQRKQKTEYRDQLMEVEVELQGKSNVPSNSMVLPNRESVNNGAFDTSRLLEEVLENRYNQSPVRRKEISKPDGGIRLLGIPTVQDR